MKIRKATKSTAGTGEITMQYAEQTFKELLAFQGYGFCLGYDVTVVERMRGIVPVGSIKVGDSILTPGDKWGERWEEVVNVIPTGYKDVYEVEFSNSRILHVTADHPLLCDDGVLRGALEIQQMNADGRRCNVMFRNMKEESIVSVTKIGNMPVMDITITGKEHLFYADGCIVHNCKAHATSYAMYSAVQMYLQEKYFIEYMCILMSHIDRADEKKGKAVLNERVSYCIKNGLNILYPSVNKPSDKWEIEGGSIRASIKNIKGFSNNDVKTIRSGAPYKDLMDFTGKVKFTQNKFDTLIFSHALDDFGDIETIYNWYHGEYLNEIASQQRKKKNEGQMTLFGEPEQKEDESSKTDDYPRRSFSVDELMDTSIDVNGFYISENLHARYHEYYERGFKKLFEVTGDSQYEKRMCIRKISYMQSLRTKNENNPYECGYILAKVLKVRKNVKVFNGFKDFILVSDGVDTVELQSSKKNSCFVPGNIVVFSVSIHTHTKRFYFNDKDNAIEPVVLNGIED